MSEVALFTSKVRWLEKGARNFVVMATKARPCIPMHHTLGMIQGSTINDWGIDVLIDCRFENP
jgi:hypothetical protein